MDCLATGHPRWRDNGLARVARESGAARAWQAALQRGAQEAAVAAEGDFSIGLREPSGRTFLAVDRFGVRPLCYRVDGGVLRFAERADVLAGPDAEIDPQAIYDYLYFHVIPSPRTIFRNVYRLPPGHYALFESGRLTVAPYWTARFDESARPAGFAALRDEFHRLLREAVARQLNGGRPACFLSGGTDSSTVAGMIREVAGVPAAAYSIGFDAAGYDEMAYARIAAKHFGAEHHEYYVTPDDLVRGIPEVAGFYDQPFGNSSALPAYYCARMARADGVQRMLAGDGGDELFGGNSRYATQRVFGAYEAIPSALRKAVMEPVFGLPAVGRTPLLRKGSRYIEQARLPMPDRLQTYNLLQRLGPDQVLGEAMLEQIDRDAPVRQQREVWSQAQTGSLVNRMLAYDWRYTLAESDLPKVRGTTQLAGVDVGFPFLDDALVDFSLRLPVDCKLKGLKLRWFFKEALRGFLPDEIIAKKKKGFGLPFGVWLTRHQGLRRLAAESLDSLAARGVVKREFVGQLLGPLLAEHPGFYGEMVWILTMLEQWLRRHAPRVRIAA